MDMDTARQMLRRLIFISGYIVLGISVACAYAYLQQGRYSELKIVVAYAGLVIAILTGDHIFAKRLNNDKT